MGNAKNSIKLSELFFRLRGAPHFDLSSFFISKAGVKHSGVAGVYFSRTNSLICSCK